MLYIDPVFQIPFLPTHQNMRELKLDHSMLPHQLATNLRRLFSGIVAGNIKEESIKDINHRGPFEIDGDPEILKNLDRLLDSFCIDQRMKLPSNQKYQPCYRILV